ncbi:MAG TPA: 2-hydroxyacid dehydrogenase [Xanthobacteraceae bacterium]|jgi:lactate dehydrogenase-like 2-hydroxyacid dehydrogenase|nr:2-hydroxyacid dehydrogenase [Xanthobacteraceae bacterium]
MAESTDVLLVGPAKPVFVEGLSGPFRLHTLVEAKDREALFSSLADRLRAIAVSATTERIDGALMSRFPRLEIVSTFGVGYDHVDAKWAGAHGITVTNTPDVLNEEVADTAIGLLLCTVRELCQAERYVRAGKWLERGYPLSKATLRDRTVGMVGMGRIGRAIARRLEAFGVPIVYHTRRALPDVTYRHYPHLIDMARDVDVLMVIVPGGAATQNMIDAKVLEALGPNGILINMARGSVVDEPALVEALRKGTILSAGIDVVVKEPEVPKELLTMDNVVVLPHLGSASVYTRQKMDQLVVDNLLAWGRGEPPLTPVPETPWPPEARKA